MQRPSPFACLSKEHGTCQRRRQLRYRPASVNLSGAREWVWGYNNMAVIHGPLGIAATYPTKLPWFKAGLEP